MTIADPLSRPSKILGRDQREAFLETGYLCLPGFIGSEWLDPVRAATDRVVEEARAVRRSDAKFDLEPDHTAEAPRLRRLMTPQDHDPAYWAFASESPVVDLAEDLLGPNLKFHHGKLNFKWSGGGAEVKWHQDIPFWPHTAYDVVTIGLALDDIDDTMGPMGVLPGSHTGPVFDHYGSDAAWCGFIGEKDLATLALDQADYLEGPAGTVTVHHCRAVHGSRPNRHPSKARPFLLNAYSAANCLPLMPYNQTSRHNGAIVRGRHPDYAVFDPEPCRLPPLPTGEYRSIFAAQKGEHRAA